MHVPGVRPRRGRTPAGAPRPPGVRAGVRAFAAVRPDVNVDERGFVGPGHAKLVGEHAHGALAGDRVRRREVDQVRRVDRERGDPVAVEAVAEGRQLAGRRSRRRHDVGLSLNTWSAEAPIAAARSAARTMPGPRGRWAPSRRPFGSIHPKTSRDGPARPPAARAPGARPMTRGDGLRDLRPRSAPSSTSGASDPRPPRRPTAPTTATRLAAPSGGRFGAVRATWTSWSTPGSWRRATALEAFAARSDRMGACTVARGPRARGWGLAPEPGGGAWPHDGEPSRPPWPGWASSPRSERCSGRTSWTGASRSFPRGAASGRRPARFLRERVFTEDRDYRRRK